MPPSSTTRKRAPWYGQTPELYILTLLSLVTRCWRLFTPHAVVWDEVHYERFAGAYFTHINYVDVHPPLAKMLIAWFGQLFGASPVALASNLPAPEARILPAVAGALIIPVVYLFIRTLGGARLSATLGATLLLVDNALLAESRLILTDGMLVLFVCVAMLAYLMARQRTGSSHTVLLGASALFAGAAASTKWTGLSALGMMLLVWLFDTVRAHRDGEPLTPWIRQAVLLIALPVIVYISAFAVHFSLLTRVGNYDYLLSERYRASLVGSASYRFGGNGMSTMEKLADTHRAMQSLNAKWVTDSNPIASKWYGWPLSRRGFTFWVQNNADGQEIQWIELFGNPAVWLGSLGLMLLVFIQWARRHPRLVEHQWSLTFLTIGYFLNYLPFAFIKRPMYLYHYFVALVFCVMIASLGGGALAGWDDARSFRTQLSARRSVPIAALGAFAVFLFLYLAPLSYAVFLEQTAAAHRMQLIQWSLH